MSTIRDRHAADQGMNWIRKDKRLAIYLRDGLACAYCGEAVEDGAKLTLDHLMPHSNGGSNEATNLVTCCHKCNSSRGNRSWMAFAGQVAAYLNHGVTADTIKSAIRRTVKRNLDLNAARELIARRGFVGACKSEDKPATTGRRISR
jgi:HNH endonuclease